MKTTKGSWIKSSMMADRYGELHPQTKQPQPDKATTRGVRSDGTVVVRNSKNEILSETKPDKAREFAHSEVERTIAERKAKREKAMLSQPQPDKATARLMLGKRPTADDGDYFTIREESTSKLICEGRWIERATAVLIVRAVNEHAALCAVAKYVEKNCNSMYLRGLLDNLAAVRGGK
jgi:hypothetical protein